MKKCLALFALALGLFMAADADAARRKVVVRQKAVQQRVVVKQAVVAPARVVVRVR